MNTNLQKELEIIWSDFDDYGYGIEQKIEAIERIKKIATKDDLPQLILGLKSEKNDFWTRELLSEPICYLDDGSYLLELFEALEKNFEDGHDNDGFCCFLTELAESEPELCKKKLLELIAMPDFKYKNRAEWLLQFCE